MKNENKDILVNDVETQISEDEIVVPPAELFDEAKEIAQNTVSDEKFCLGVKYDVNEKGFLLSILRKVGVFLEDDDEEEGEDEEEEVVAETASNEIQATIRSTAVLSSELLKRALERMKLKRAHRKEVLELPAKRVKETHEYNSR